MLQPIAQINKQLAKYLSVLPSAEVKALLALMLQANPIGVLRTSPVVFGALIGVTPKRASALLKALAKKRLILLRPRGDTYVVLVRAFLGKRGLPLDSELSTATRAAPELSTRRGGL